MSASRMFALFEKVPTIDAYSDKGHKPVSMTLVMRCCDDEVEMKQQLNRNIASPFMSSEACIVCHPYNSTSQLVWNINFVASLTSFRSQHELFVAVA